MKESLEIKLKLVEQDNQNLRQTLLSSNRKYANNEKYSFKLLTWTDLRNRLDSLFNYTSRVRMSKSRIEEINELIERAQINAKTMMASNPNYSNLIETR